MEPLFSPELHVFYEHTKIPLAVYYVEDGRFYAYLVSEGACEMYEFTREEMLMRLNGPDPLVNIVEKEEMVQAIKAFSDKGESYNVVFHEYIGRDRKLKTIHGIGNHEYTRDGRRYSVIRYDEISDRSRQMLFREEEEEIQRQQNLLNEIDDAIARSFTSVIYVDKETGLTNVVRLNRLGKVVREKFGETANIRDVIDGYVNALVYKEDAKAVLKYGDLEYVLKCLEDTNPLFHTYRTIRDGRIVYYRLKIIPFDNGKKIIYGFEHYDAQVREEIARKSEQDTQMTLLAGLSCEYESIWLVDAAIHHARLIRSNIKRSASDTEMNAVKEGSYETIIGNYIDTFVVEEDRERVYQFSAIDHLMRATKEDEIYHINYCRLNPEGERNYLQLSIARVTDDMGVVRFVCGFRNIDAIIEEEKHKNLLYSMAHMDNMTNVSNRRTFDEYMDSKEAATMGEDFVFFSFDLNDLKEANDSCGHEAGDELIVGAAVCMKKVLGEFGSIFRTGGDEFAALVNIPADKKDETIKRLMDEFDSWHGKLYPSLSISMGYVCATEDRRMTIDDMRREADKRMYAQKSDHYMQEGYDRRRSRKQN